MGLELGAVHVAGHEFATFAAGLYGARFEKMWGDRAAKRRTR